MNEYITKKQAVDLLRSLPNPCELLQLHTIAVAIYFIEKEPAADVQPVVHCKDCKHRKERHYEEIGEKPYIKYECKFTKYSMSDDGFCSFGARTEQEG